MGFNSAFKGLMKERNKRRYFLFSKQTVIFFYVHESVHRESMSIIVQQDATINSLLYFCKLLYIFRMVTPPASPR